MSATKITLQNYRAFPQNKPLTLEIRDGITFVLGVNNVGKSALIRMSVELGPCLSSFFEQGSLNATAQFTHSFETIAHRATPSQPIKLTVEKDDSRWIFVISPREGPQSPHVSVNVSPQGSSAGAGVPESIRSLFIDALYVPSFRSPTVQTQDAVFGLKIGHLFVREWDEWANGPRLDHSSQVGVLIEELQGLFGFRKFDISVGQHKDRLLIKSEDGRFSLDELGDGISHYIIVLGNAMIRKPAWILIDEPEIGLHPRMQEMFVRALASKARFGMMATSHSVGLARSVADQLLIMTKDNDGGRHLKPFGEHHITTISQSISEMGYSQFAELGGNHLLLVEGRTDIKAFREILRKFQLDQHFIIWSLNGSDWLKASPEKIADELGELKRFNAKSVSVIFDSERADDQTDMSASVRPFHELCLKLGFNVFATDRHSTENYITQAALDQVCPQCTALTEFEVFGANGRKWEKSKNWLMFREMTRADLEGSGLGRFITGVLKPAVEA